MSRINSGSDRPIQTNEPTTTAQQILESNSTQTTGKQGIPLAEADQRKSPQAAETESKEQMMESRLGGLARQTDLQLQLPLTPTPVLKEFPGLHPNADPNIHLDEKVDVTKNLPDGHSIDSGLAGLTDLDGKGIKSGPNHMGVSLTTGGMKAPADVIADVLNSPKLGQSNPSAQQSGQSGGDYKSVEGGGVKADSISKGSGQSTPPPGADLGARAPKWNQVGGESGGVGNTSSDDLKAFAGIAPKSEGPTAKEQIQEKIDSMKASSDKEHQDWLKKTAPDGGTKKMTDPDADTGGGVGTSSGNELSRLIAIRGGFTDPGRGDGSPAIEGGRPQIRYGDLVTDGGDGSSSSAAEDSSGGVIIPGGGFTDPTRPDITPGGDLPPSGGNDPSNDGNPS